LNATAALLVLDDMRVQEDIEAVHSLNEPARSNGQSRHTRPDTDREQTSSMWEPMAMEHFNPIFYGEPKGRPRMSPASECIVTVGRDRSGVTSCPERSL
jgi:hypothetical protein